MKLNTKELFTLLFWFIFKTYKVYTVKYYEEQGMAIKFAFKKAKEITKKEFKETLKVKLCQK